MVLDFKVENGSLTYTAPKGWAPQFCYRHSGNPCEIQPVFGNLETNCNSALHWSGDYVGDTKPYQILCQ
ncbi:MAG: hypothetical protein V4736_02585 [Bdellovibrionota bacterium]